MKRKGNHSEVLLRSADLVECLTLVQNYFDYVEFLNKGKNEKIAQLKEEALENVRKSEELLDGFSIVRFIGKDGKLMIASPESEHICFSLASFSKNYPSETEEIIEMLRDRIKGYHKEIDELGERESEARKAFDDYVPVQPRRKKHSFGFIKWEEIDKEYAEKENIRRIKKLEEKLDSVLHRIDTTKFQIECNDVIMNRIEDTKNFVVGLSDEDRLAIREKYHLIEGLFYQNEEIYAKIARIEELKKNVPSFTEYFRENVSEPERTKFNKFTAFLDKTFSYANEQQFKKSAERIKKITDLTKYVDFGEYNRHVDCVALAMDHEKQLEDQRRKEERVKANANKQNGKKNPVVKKKTVSSSESENGKSL